MLKVGLTGGIGSGKTIVANVFKQLGVSVYSSDDRAKALMTENASLRSALCSQFGDKAFVDGVLNRAYIASKVFSNKKALEELNALVHPAVEEDFRTWCDKQNSPYVIKEAAILIESGGHKQLNQIILVQAPEQIRISRVLKRDGGEQSHVLARMKEQWSDTQKEAHAQHIISNDGKSSVLEQVLKLHDYFKSQ